MLRLDRAWILAHIPHQGRMCLVDEVTHWDAERLTCRSSNHGSADHPLRAHGRLGILCGVEYAAQAMAIHGALTATRAAAGTAVTGTAVRGTAADLRPAAATAAATSATTPPGFLAALRSVIPHVSRLDDVPGQLLVTAARIAGDHTSALYEFEVCSAVECLLSGRATVVLDAGSLSAQ